MDSQRIRNALWMVGKTKSVKDLPAAFAMVCWELMKTQTKVKEMDAKIRKIEKTTKKAEKELKSLEKADKKRDRVCDYGKAMMKKKKKAK